MGMAEYAAARHGVTIVDTFNMTISRFKEFYPGKCACHFHKVITVVQWLWNDVCSVEVHAACLLTANEYLWPTNACISLSI